LFPEVQEVEENLTQGLILNQVLVSVFVQYKTTERGVVGGRGTQKYLEICETSRLIGKLRTLCIGVLG
jgi:hypothetical protein